MSEPSSPSDPPDRWAGLRAAFAPKPEGPDKEELAALRGAVAEAAGLLRAYTVGYLTVALYLAVTAANTTHEQLLIGKEITLPVVNVGVPLVGFYVLAPAVFVVLHGNLLYHLEALARRVRRFAERVQALDPAAQEQARLLLVPFQFVEWRAGRGHRHGLSDLATWALYFASGPAVLLVLQLGFLPYQHDLVTPWHILWLAADGALAWRAWDELRDSGDAPAAAGARWPDQLARAAAACAVLASLWLWWDVYAANRFSRIVVEGGVLMAAAPSADRLGAYRQELLEKSKGLSIEEAEVEALRALGKPVDLAERNLRKTFLGSVKMMGADLGGAQLQGAYLGWAELQGVDLRTAQLQGADLGGADLRGADLSGAELQDANLTQTKLQGAYLGGAELQGANLTQTKLQGTDLAGAELQGTDLAGAELQGVDLRTAQLQGADLSYAQLQGADLSYAQLRGADLGGARLQGADLHEAGMFLVRMDAETDLSLVDLRQAKAAPLPPEARAALKAEIDTAITKPEQRAQVLARLEPVLRDPPPTWKPAALPAEKRRDAIVSADAPEPIRALTGHAALLSPGDDGRYGEVLAGELARLACGLGDERVASRLVQRMRRLDRGTYLPGLDRHLRTGCPDLIAKLDPDAQEVLTDAAAKAASTGVAGGAPQAPAPATAIQR